MEQFDIGDYRVLREVRNSDFGMVYLADHRFLKKRFYIQVVSEDLAQKEDFIKRFEEQMAKVATVEHPHIAKIHTVSCIDNKYVLVMEAPAENLQTSTHLKEFVSVQPVRLSESKVHGIVKQLASALDALHAKTHQGIPLYHGNIRLDNILVGNSTQEIPYIFLADVGLSQVLGQEEFVSRYLKNLYDVFSSGEERNYKQTQRALLQQHAFLAPEQRGAVVTKGIDFKVDIYAFGVLVYYLLMGYFPDGAFLYPSEALPSLKMDWDPLIRSCLRAQPDKRPYNLTTIVEQLSEKELQECKETIAAVTEQTVSHHSYIKEAALPPKKKHCPHSAIEASLSPTASATLVKPLSETEQKKERKPKINPSELQKLEYDEDPGAIFQTKKDVAPYIPTEKDVSDIRPPECEMVIIEGGEYARGSDVASRDARPRHKIQIDSFALDKHPVTNEHFLRFLEVMGGEKDHQNNDMILLKESRIRKAGGKFSIESGYAQHPVVGVSWYGAVAYAKWVGKRLPTEAEWEIAASGGIADNVYPSGADLERACANFFNTDTTKVKSYPSNLNDLYDMDGNVYEWCEDWYDPDYYRISLQNPNNPKGPRQGVYRSLRGGCWKSLEEDLQCAHRHRNNPLTMNRTYGFRCAADVTEST